MAHIPRVLCPAPLTENTNYELSPERAHHLHTVMRRSVGSHVRAWDGQGSESTATIVNLNHKSGTITSTKVEKVSTESPLRLLLGQAIGRGDRFEAAMIAAIELGAFAIQPLWTEYGLPPMKAQRREKKLSSWQAQALGAAEQAERSRLPEVLAPSDFGLWLRSLSQAEPDSASGPRGVLLHPDGQLLGPEHLKSIRPGAQGTRPFSVLVGPEGGWSEKEVAAAEAAGFSTVSMGPRILRTEHAGPAMLAMLQAMAGDTASHHLPTSAERP